MNQKILIHAAKKLRENKIEPVPVYIMFSDKEEGILFSANPPVPGRGLLVAKIVKGTEKRALLKRIGVPSDLPKSLMPGKGIL